VKVARTVSELERKPRAVAIGTFDGVHTGHRRILGAAVDAGLDPTVVTFDPHPRVALGYEVDMLSSLERRLELIAEEGIESALVVEFTLEVARIRPEDFAHDVLAAIGTEVVVAGESFRFGHGRSGDVELLRSLGFEVRPVPLVEGVSSTLVRGLVRSAGRPRSRASSSRATHGAGRSASRRRTWRSTRAWSCPHTASTPVLGMERVRRSRSGRTRTTAARSGAWRRSCSTS